MGRLTAAHQLTLLSAGSDLPTLRIRATAQVALKICVGTETVTAELPHSDSEISIDLFEMLYGETCVLRAPPALSLSEVLKRSRSGLPLPTTLEAKQAPSSP